MARGLRECLRSLVKAQQLRPGQLVQLAVVLFVRHRSNRDVGDVVGIDKRLTHVACGQRDHTFQDRAEEVAFIEVLIEPRRADQRVGQARVADDLLAALSIRLTPARQQNNLAHARRLAIGHELRDVPWRFGDGQVGVVSDVHRIDTRKCCGPAR